MATKSEDAFAVTVELDGQEMTIGSRELISVAWADIAPSKVPVDYDGFPADEVSYSLTVMLAAATEDAEIDRILAMKWRVLTAEDPDEAALEVRQAYLTAVATWLNIIFTFYARATYLLCATYYVWRSSADDVDRMVAKVKR